MKFVLIKIFKLKSLSPFFCVALLLVFSQCSKTLPQLGQLPDFQLQDHNGQTVSPKNFQGKVVAVNFVFTSCAGTCPLLTERMKKVQNFIENTQKDKQNSPYHIVSFSVDPDRDTPEVLRKYMKSYEVNPKIWSFLTGPYQEVEKTVVQGFKISMAKAPTDQAKEDSEEPVYDVIHGEKFILIDPKGQIRGYFDATEAGIYQLTQAMVRLAKS